ncbi:MAG: sensor histidine kinase [Prevotellaceae bacterium]|jgi:nitrogen fixation/metabolism regulation signal transduction histidine kinase|nr:sensor histidine kinase [Prevotellaceae bacterium]
MKHKYHISFLCALTVALGVACGWFLTNCFALGLLFAAGTLAMLFHTIGRAGKFFRDVHNFAEAARYRDFSKRYPERTGWKGNDFYRYFNEISDVFRALSKEKELQQQHLKRMLELINTGILAYHEDTNEILWLNDAFRTMFDLPLIKNINWLKTRRETLYRELRDIPTGHNRLITVTARNQSVKTLINAHLFQTGGKTYKMIAFHNINATLEEIEANAWKSLLNVMTHEIMNSIAPVASLADTLKKRIEGLRDKNAATIKPDFEDIGFAMDTIHRRSEGLLRFADTYRNLSKTIVPDIRPTHVPDVLAAIHQLMQPSLQQKNILLEIQAERLLPAVPMDRNLIEQVLINFITNAAYAVREKAAPQIILFAGVTADKHPYITVADNGCGISPDVRDKIFIPFFSTRKNGTGIGLSLSREIVKLHDSQLRIQSREGEGSAFTILFPNLSEGGG